MRKHPLLAFATTTVGLSIGATTFCTTSAFAATGTGHGQVPPNAIINVHRDLAGHLGRAIANGQSVPTRSKILLATGPTGFLLPGSGSHTTVVPPSSAPGYAGELRVWALLRSCESGGNYQENSGNGYYGAYQFALNSWFRVGETGLPSLAPAAVQDVAARRLLAIQGWRAWPRCSVLLGYA